MLVTAPAFSEPTPAIAQPRVQGGDLAAQPRTHDDPVLGRLEFDRSLRQWRGSAQWGAVRVRLVAEGEVDELLADSLATAHALWQSLDAWDARVRRVAADQLLSLYEDTWRDAVDGPELDATAFGERILLQSIVVYPDGEFELWFGDDDLFGGHSIRVVGSLADGPQAATIEG